MAPKGKKEPQAVDVTGIVNRIHVENSDTKDLIGALDTLRGVTPDKTCVPTSLTFRSVFTIEGNYILFLSFSGR